MPDAVGVLDPYGSDATTVATLEVGGQTISNITRFSYSSDVLTLGDPWEAVIPNPRGQWTGKLPVGSSVNYYLTNPAANGGQKTTKIKGIVTERSATSEMGGGTVITLRGADLGWHLANNSAPPWFRLQGATMQTLLQATIQPQNYFRARGSGPNSAITDPGWGFVGVRGGNEQNRKIKMGRAAAQAALSPSVTTPLCPIQISPGETIADVLILYAKRFGLLLNVSADGYLQFFRPNYSQSTRYVLHYHNTTEPDATRNNVLRATLTEGCESVYTDVECFSEVVAQPVLQTGTNPNAGKYWGRYRDASALPFLHRTVFTDTEQMGQDRVNQRAKWKHDRGVFDAWSLTYTVRGHAQRRDANDSGVWWEADTMVDVNDSVNGVRGSYYVSAVRCYRDMQSGDRTDVTIRKPNLLGA